MKRGVFTTSRNGMNRCSLLLCSKGRGALGSTSARRSVLAGSRGGRGGKTGGFERWGPGCDGCEQERSPRRLVPVDPTTSRTGTRQASGTCTLRLDVFGSREGEGERDRGLGIVLLSPPFGCEFPVRPDLRRSSRFRSSGTKERGKKGTNMPRTIPRLPGFVPLRHVLLLPRSGTESDASTLRPIPILARTVLFRSFPPLSFRIAIEIPILLPLLSNGGWRW